jgi:lipopolysaccharide transport system ATP-binding protein
VIQYVIRAEGLGKRFVGVGRHPSRAFHDSIERLVRAPLRGLLPSREPDSSDFWALRNVSFTVEPGEAIGVVGANGAGKSVLLKILSRVTAPSEGHAEVWGRVGALLEVGAGFHPELSGRENVYLNGAILGMTREQVRRKFDEIVAFSEIESFIDTPIKLYSSGMRMRLAFSVAAHLEPDILLIDEAFAVGDASFRAKCRQKIAQFILHGCTLLLVSHDSTIVSELCHRAILIEGGLLISDGTPAKILDRYARRNASR